jgi:hypothetical protein
MNNFSTDKKEDFLMREEKFELKEASELVNYCKSVNSPIKMNKRCADIILATCSTRDVTLLNDAEGHIYQSGAEGEEFLTTLDDVIDAVCEWNYEDIEAAERMSKLTDDYIGKCKINSMREKLQKDERALNFIFYQTKYGKSVERIADKIAKEVMEQLNLIPVYDLPFYEDKIREEPKEEKTQPENTDKDKNEDVKIVASDPVAVRVDEPEKEKEESKGAR